MGGCWLAFYGQAPPPSAGKVGLGPSGRNRLICVKPHDPAHQHRSVVKSSGLAPRRGQSFVSLAMKAATAKRQRPPFVTSAKALHLHRFARHCSPLAIDSDAHKKKRIRKTGYPSTRWRPPEEERLRALIGKFGESAWAFIAEQLDTGRTAKGVEQHWQVMTGK